MVYFDTFRPLCIPYHMGYYGVLPAKLIHLRALCIPYHMGYYGVLPAKLILLGLYANLTILPYAIVWCTACQINTFRVFANLTILPYAIIWCTACRIGSVNLYTYLPWSC